MDRNVVLHSLANLADLYISIGRRLTQKGQPETAYWAYDTALLLSENAPDMLNKILSVFQEAGNYNGALKYFEKIKTCLTLFLAAPFWRNPFKPGKPN